MTQDNPYQAPSANVFAAGDHDVKQPRSVATGRGVDWLSAGWQYFRASPGPWAGATLIWFVVMSVASMVPLINWATGILSPVFAAGFIAGCMHQDDGGPFRVDDLFAGFRKRTVPLLLVGLLQMVAIFIVVFIAGIIGAAVLFASVGLEVLDNPEMLADSGAAIAILLVTLIAMLLFLPIAMGAWFAPALVMHGNKAPVEAVLLSLRGCMKNVMPFLPYGLLLILLTIPVVLTLGLGIILLAPVVNASIYVAYKDIFVHDDTVLGHGTSAA